MLLKKGSRKSNLGYRTDKNAVQKAHGTCWCSGSIRQVYYISIYISSVELVREQSSKLAHKFCGRG